MIFFPFFLNTNLINKAHLRGVHHANSIFYNIKQHLGSDSLTFHHCVWWQTADTCRTRVTPWLCLCRTYAVLFINNHVHLKVWAAPTASRSLVQLGGFGKSSTEVVWLREECWEDSDSDEGSRDLCAHHGGSLEMWYAYLLHRLKLFIYKAPKPSGKLPFTLQIEWNYVPRHGVLSATCADDTRLQMSLSRNSRWLMGVWQTNPVRFRLEGKQRRTFSFGWTSKEVVHKLVGEPGCYCRFRYSLANTDLVETAAAVWRVCFKVLWVLRAEIIQKETTQKYSEADPAANLSLRAATWWLMTLLRSHTHTHSISGEAFDVCASLLVYWGQGSDGRPPQPLTLRLKCGVSVFEAFFFFLNKLRRNVPAFHLPIDPSREGDAEPGSGL